MIKYKNLGRGLQTILFEDGSAKFLFRGEVFLSDKAVRQVDDDIRTEEVEPEPKTAKSKPARKSGPKNQD